MKIKLIKSLGLLTLSFLIFYMAIVQAFSADLSESQQYNNNPVVATVDGQLILMNDLKTPKMQELMLQLHEMQGLALKRKILESLAKKHPELGADKAPQVSNQDVINFYENTPEVQKLGSLEKIKNEVRNYLEGALEEAYIETQYKRAVQKGWVKVYLSPPSDFHIDAPVNTARLRFNDGHLRRVFLLEFSDFQCPFCKRVQTTLGKLRERYGRQVQFGYRHFPLPFHKEAKFLAEAVECAGDQERFWHLHSLFFTQSSIASDLNRVMELVEQAGVKNLDEFTQCWNGGKYRERVKNDILEGSEIGVQSTPSFILGIYNPETRVISGDLFSGAVPEEQFVRSIEKYLSILNPDAKSNQ